MKKLLILFAACALTFSCGESNDDFGDNGNPGTEIIICIFVARFI